MMRFVRGEGASGNDNTGGRSAAVVCGSDDELRAPERWRDVTERLRAARIHEPWRQR